jgi:hypothetical protein
VPNLERGTDLEKLLVRLWDRFLIIRAIDGETSSFDQFWYKFLTKNFMEDKPIGKTYEDLCKD